MNRRNLSDKQVVGIALVGGILWGLVIAALGAFTLIQTGNQSGDLQAVIKIAGFEGLLGVLGTMCIAKKYFQRGSSRE